MALFGGCPEASGVVRIRVVQQVPDVQLVLCANDAVLDGGVAGVVAAGGGGCWLD